VQRGSNATTAGSATALTGWSAPSGGQFAYVTRVECGRDDSGTLAAWVTLNDTASTIIVLPPSGGNNPVFDPPLRVNAVNTAPTFTPSTPLLGTKGAGCAAQGFNGP